MGRIAAPHRGEPTTKKFRTYYGGGDKGMLVYGTVEKYRNPNYLRIKRPLMDILREGADPNGAVNFDLELLRSITSSTRNIHIFTNEKFPALMMSLEITTEDYALDKNTNTLFLNNRGRKRLLKWVNGLGGVQDAIAFISKRVQAIKTEG